MKLINKIEDSILLEFNTHTEITWKKPMSNKESKTLMKTFSDRDLDIKIQEIANKDKIDKEEKERKRILSLTCVHEYVKRFHDMIVDEDCKVKSVTYYRCHICDKEREVYD